MPDFKVASAEFKRQLVTLDLLLVTVEVTSQQDGLTPVLVGQEPLPVLPADGKNTMAAAAIVLLAAHFEEYVRQQIEEYATGVMDYHDYLPDNLREKIVDSYWRAGTNGLSRIRPSGFPGWINKADLLLRSLTEYPVEANVAAFHKKLIVEHENNMRFDTMAEVCARVGIKGLSDLIYRSKPVRDILGSPKKDQFAAALRRDVNEFYEIRNGIVHSIAQNAGIGRTVVTKWSIFFDCLTLSSGSRIGGVVREVSFGH